jgi:hypothetical protein
MREIEMPLWNSARLTLADWTTKREVEQPAPGSGALNLLRALRSLFTLFAVIAPIALK